MYTRFETEAMNFILAGDNPVLSELRKQFSESSLTNRENDGYGFFLHFNIPADIQKLTDIYDIKPDFTITDVQVRFAPEYKLFGLALFIKDGLIDFLDGYPLEGEAWPDSVSDFHFCYSTDAERDINSLEDFWKK